MLLNIISKHFKINFINLKQLLSLLSINVVKIVQTNITNGVLPIGPWKLDFLFHQSSKF